MLGRTVVASLVACLAACSSSNTNSGSETGSTGGSSSAAGSPAAAAGSAGQTSTSAGGGGASSFAGTSGIAGGFASGGTYASGGASGATTGGSGGMSGGGTSAGGGTASGGAGGTTSTGPAAKQSWIWVWQQYDTMLSANGPVFSKPTAFTHVSPALYNLNFNKSYSSGVADLNNSDDNYDGMTSKQVAATIHAAGLKVIPLMYAGAGNSGVDTGIQNILSNDTTQKNFIDAMVQEAVTKGYDGYNLDWEVQGTTYNPYGPELVKFLTAFTAALHQHNMISSFDTAGWYTNECAGDGLVKLSEIGNSVDQMIMEDYAGTFQADGNKLGTACAPVKSANCDNDFVGELNTMCNLPPGVGNIGLMSPYGNEPSTNPFLDKAMLAIQAYGFRAVSLWPDNGTITDTNVPAKAGDASVKTWRTWLAWWLTQP